MYFYYDECDSLLGFEYNGTPYLYIRNIQGDIYGITDVNGTLLVQYEYDAWGKVKDIIGNQALGQLNPMRYRGYYYDEETGLYYLQSRYYDANVRRFINADAFEMIVIAEFLLKPGIVHRKSILFIRSNRRFN